MKITELENKKILIAGYGVEGKATEQFLQKCVPSAVYEITDQKDGDDYLDMQDEFDLVIKTPGIPKDEIHVPYTTATNIFFANLDLRHTTIGVTGTKGKSTTASLIYHILRHSDKKAELVGNIGKPMLEFFGNEPTENTIFVCELSSYQLDDIQYSPHISVVVSLFPDHIPYHGSVESYYEAKHNIIAHSSEKDFYIYNPKFSQLVGWARSAQSQAVPYENDFIPAETELIGKHNQDNIKAAVTVARLFEIPDKQIAQAVKTFQPLPHRLQKVGTFKEITFYDDAISTTPESTIAALVALADIKTIFLGGEDRGYDFIELVEMLKKREIENVVLFPDSGSRIKEAAEKAKVELRLKETDSMEEAVRFAYEVTPPGSICLLSTASPSYSLWKNYIEKGDQFQKFVKQYAA